MHPLRTLTATVTLALASLSGIAADTVQSPKMKPIPAGKLHTLTCPPDMDMCPEHAYIEREVTVPAFEMAATEVTFAEWDACIQDKGCVNEKSDWAFMNRPVHAPCVEGEVCQHPHDQGWGRGQRPVINVSWDDVQQYIKWLNAKTGSNYRLPTSEEWEYAALAGATTTFDWGNNLGKNRANCDGCGSKWDNRQTAPVGSFKPNRFGLHDMVGNVSEWVSSCFPTRVRKGEVSHTCMAYLIRGSAWSFVAKAADPRGYNSGPSTLRDRFLGFRLARSAPAPQ
jgi:formylglycine-generating enzyme required for sulfatase activity